MAKVTGLDCKLYYNTGTYAAPVWVEVDEARDVSFSITINEADASSRASNWKQTLRALKDASIEFEMSYDATNAAFTGIRTNFFTDTDTEFAVMDGDIVGPNTEGIRAMCAITSFSRNEPLEDGVTASVTVKPTPNNDADPAWYAV